MARQRSPERAKAVLDRAARMQSFRPSRADQRANDPQMRTPGKHTKALNVNDLPASAFKKVGKQSVNPRDIITDQPTVSRAQVKAKIDRMASGEKVSGRLIQRPDGKFQMLDGNHGATAARALGRNVEAEIFKVSKGGPAPAGKPLSALTKVGLTATAIAPVVAGANAYNAKIAAGGSKTEAMGEAIQQGTVAGAGALTATGVMAGMAKAAQMVAPKVAPALGPIGLAIGAGMSAYGAYKGYQNTGTVSGALKGAVGLDTAKAATAPANVMKAGLTPDDPPGDLKDAPDRLSITPEVRELPQNANMNKIAEHSFRVDSEFQTRAQARVAKNYERAYQAADRVMARKGELAGMKEAPENNSYGESILQGINGLNPKYAPGKAESGNIEDRRGEPLPPWNPNTGVGASQASAQSSRYSTPKELEHLLPKTDTVGADPTTMAIANPTTPGQSRGLGGDSATKGSIGGEKTATGGSKFERANTSFSQDRAAKEKQQEQSTDSGDGEKQRGWGWKARAASAKSRGIQEWNHPEE